MLSKKQAFIKRFFDVVLALFLLPFLLIPLFLLWLAATISTNKNGLFTQQRIGKAGAPFTFYKLRSLRGKDHADLFEMKQHVTPFGAWLRRSKLDELPQLFNVLKGDMSFVGPRPDIPGYADVLTGDDRIILMVRPGITGPATLKYKNEESLLVQQKDSKSYNDTVIWPDKVKINKQYVQNWSFAKDLVYLWKSVFGGAVR